MANKSLFQSIFGKLIPATDALNEEQAPAYRLSPKHALAQYAATGCLNNTFYATAGEQLETVLELCRQVEPRFVAQAAVYCRDLGAEEWKAIARTASWQTTRMNLNTFARHGVFESAEMRHIVAARLRNPDEVRRARVFPYQLLTTFQAVGEEVPSKVRMALQDAMELATANVPVINGRLVVCPDVSGSMQSPVTGRRSGSSTRTRCVDVAALAAASLVRKNPDAVVMPFEQRVVSLEINPRDRVMTNAEKLAGVGGGGTNCSAPLALLNRRREQVDFVVFVSDNESWVDAHAGRGTKTMVEWNRLRERNPDARLACVDLQPYGTTQAVERSDILNVGGFSDQVFELLARFAENSLAPDHWVGEIEKVMLQ